VKSGEQVIEKACEDEQADAGTDGETEQRDYLAFVDADENVKIYPHQQQHERTADARQNHGADRDDPGCEKERQRAAVIFELRIGFSGDIGGAGGCRHDSFPLDRGFFARRFETVFAAVSHRQPDNQCRGNQTGNDASGRQTADHAVRYQCRGHNQAEKETVGGVVVIFEKIRHDAR